MRTHTFVYGLNLKSQLPMVTLKDLDSFSKREEYQTILLSSCGEMFFEKMYFVFTGKDKSLNLKCRRVPGGWDWVYGGGVTQNFSLTYC